MESAVNVNVAVEGIDFASRIQARFQSTQAQDAGGDEVALPGPGIRSLMPAFPGGDASGENHAHGGVMADLSGHLVEPPRGALGLILAGARPFAEGDRIGSHACLALVVIEFFLAKCGNEHILPSF